MAQPLTNAATLLGGFESAGLQTVIVAAGGGSAAIPHLVTTPGGSTVVLECLVPSARAAVDRLLGGPQESYCSSRTARRLAGMAWQRACALGASADTAVGAAVTASLRSRIPKRGPHQIVVAVQTLLSTSVATLVLQKDARPRADEELLAAALLLERLATVLCETAPVPDSSSLMLLGDEHVKVASCQPPAAWRELLAGTRAAVQASHDPSRSRADAAPSGPPPGGSAGRLIFPGSFDPLHDGHLGMALVAEEIAERPLDFELSIVNVDKPPLDYLEMQSRAAQFTGRSLWFTRAATFAEKLDVFPGSTFVMGADTYARLADPKYYGGSHEAAKLAVQRICDQARGLIVFGRERHGCFEDPAQLDVPAALREVTYFVSKREFKLDISSTELRQRARDF